MQINRLFEIVNLLLNKKMMTAKELAKHFEVSVRTIYRDIETLTFSGIPIYSSRGKNGGVKILESYILNKSIVSQDEQNEILNALQSLKASNYPKIDEILKKFSIIFNKTPNDWIEIDFSPYNIKNNIMFENVKTAILNKITIRFIYYNSKGEKSERIADPLKMWFKEKNWYLFAYCHQKKDIRQFKINRIRDIVLTEKSFDKRIEDFKIDNKNDIKKGIEITVEIDKSQLYRVYDDFLEENIKKLSNGNFEVTMEYFENEWLYGYLLSFGEYLKVKEPKRIKDILLDKIKKMRENNL